MADLRGRVVVVTGASSGLGRAAALGFSRQGARLVLVSRNDDALDNIAKECVDSGGEALTFPADVADFSAVEEIRGFAVSHFGRIDVWVNCAAVLIFGRFEEVPPPLFHRLVDTNVFGYINGSQVALKQFRSQGDRGVLINVSSISVSLQSLLSVYMSRASFSYAGSQRPSGRSCAPRQTFMCVLSFLQPWTPLSTRKRRICSAARRDPLSLFTPPSGPPLQLSAPRAILDARSGLGASHSCWNLAAGLRHHWWNG
ncbi:MULTISPECIES: SDR family NAD(P)-dependent oxidoreductase [Mesorhizobium]|uniref:SDR family NAD(P)-dependent oxidoreductase n=1 Tax=Mesorhizobium sp. AA22 TaxID=1854057 RepID=UPI0009F34AF1|nr:MULTISPECIES: SDR family NAD(P)-dependent oxidoreductase [Mesorhizobium]PBB52501.1 hypothetical protein CK223_29050 [Mesorhizobium loti]QIA25488.1 SDR family NAD(P)-dependent oxidoreductase [Mesorhizobium sp. AA22]